MKTIEKLKNDSSKYQLDTILYQSARKIVIIGTFLLVKIV